MARVQFVRPGHLAGGLRRGNGERQRRAISRNGAGQGRLRACGVDPGVQPLQRPALQARDRPPQMLGVRLQIVAFFSIGDIARAIERCAPKARRRFRLLFDGLEAAADLVVQRHRAVQFGNFRFAQRELRPNFSRRQHLPDVTENEPGQRRPQREQDRVDEKSRQLSAAFRHEHARDSTERYATNADSRGRITSPSPKRLGAEPDRMLAADGQNTGEPGRSKADDFSARD